MRYFTARVLIFHALLICLALDVAGQGSPGSSNSFPISAGNYWIYQGIVRWTHANSNETSETKVTWKMKILRVIHHGDYLAAVVSGWPMDLDWSDGHPAVADSLLIRSHDGKFYRIGQRQFNVAFKRMDDSNDSLEGLLSDDDLVLDLPLKEGKKFCDSEGMARTDGHYCWVVGQPSQVSLDNIKGLQPGQRTAFPVSYLTNPDDSEYEFVPGVGMTTYGYHHHGTVADTELRLTEIHIESGP